MIIWNMNLQTIEKRRMISYRIELVFDFIL